MRKYPMVMLESVRLLMYPKKADTDTVKDTETVTVTVKDIDIDTNTDKDMDFTFDSKLIFRLGLHPI